MRMSSDSVWMYRGSVVRPKPPVAFKATEVYYAPQTCQ